MRVLENMLNKIDNFLESPVGITFGWIWFVSLLLSFSVDFFDFVIGGR